MEETEHLVGHTNTTMNLKIRVKAKQFNERKKKQRNKEILNISGDPNSCKPNRKEDEKERDR